MHGATTCQVLWWTPETHWRIKTDMMLTLMETDSGRENNFFKKTQAPWEGSRGLVYSEDSYSGQESLLMRQLSLDVNNEKEGTKQRWEGRVFLEREHCLQMPPGEEGQVTGMGNEGELGPKWGCSAGVINYRNYWGLYPGNTRTGWSLTNWGKIEGNPLQVLCVCRETGKEQTLCLLTLLFSHLTAFNSDLKSARFSSPSSWRDTWDPENVSDLPRVRGLFGGRNQNPNDNLCNPMIFLMGMR